MVRNFAFSTARKNVCVNLNLFIWKGLANCSIADDFPQEASELRCHLGISQSAKQRKNETQMKLNPDQCDNIAGLFVEYLANSNIKYFSIVT